MPDDKLKQKGKTARLMREEKLAFGRLKDNLRKYRILIPYISDRSEGIERKIELLMEHREKSEEQGKMLKVEKERTLSALSSLERKDLDVEVRRNSLLARYNALLAGEIPATLEPASSDLSVEALRREKEKFIGAIGGAFEKIESELKALDVEKRGIESKRVKVHGRLDKIKGRQQILEGKIAIIRGDIRKSLMELNDHIKNERSLKQDYARLVSILKKCPDVTEWGIEVLKETISQKEPGRTVIELGKQSMIPLNRGSAGAQTAERQMH